MRREKMLATIISLGLSAYCLTSNTYAVGLDSQSGTLTHRAPDKLTVIDGPFPFVVGSGTEFDGTMVGYHYVVDISAASVALTVSDPGCCATGHPFNGPVLTFSGLPLPGIQNVSLVSTTIAGFDSSRVSFTSNEIHMNFQSLDLRNDRQLILEVSAVPEPTTYAMFLVGLGALLGFIRRRPR